MPPHPSGPRSLAPHTIWIESSPRPFLSEIKKRVALAAGNWEDSIVAFDSLGKLLTESPPPSLGIGSRPDLIVLVPAWSGAIRQAEVEEVRRAFPLAGWVQIVTPWLDGTPRSGRPLMGVLSVPWFEARSWLEIQAAAWRHGNRPMWSGMKPIDQAWPADSGETLDDGAASPTMGRTIGLCAADRSLLDVYRELLTRDQHTLCTIDLSSDREPAPELAAVIWDDAPHCGQSAQELERLALRISPVPILAVCSLLRPHEVADYCRQGATTVLGKPLSLHVLRWELARILRTRGPATAARQ